MAEANDVVFILEDSTARQEHSRTAPPNAMSLPLAGTVPDPTASVAFILFASCLFPARTARRTLKMGLPACWLLHFGVAVFGAIAIPCLFVAITESPIAVLRGVEEVLTEWDRHAVEVTVVLLGLAIWIEVIHLSLAFVVFAWGGVAGERLRDSYRHSLRQVWLRTPHAVLVVILICAVAITLDKAGDQLRVANPEPSASLWPDYPTLPTIPKSDPTYAASQKQYKTELRDFEVKSIEADRVWRQWHLAQPWYLRNEEEVSVMTGIVGAGWWLSALLCAVGIRREASPLSRSPHCLWCGYDLSTLRFDNRCPECGQSVERSLGENAQPGAAWEKHKEAGAFTSWRQTWVGATRDTGAFGRSLKLAEQRNDHRGFLVWHLPAIFLLGATGIAAAATQDEGFDTLRADWSLTMLMMSLSGAVCVMATVVGTCGSASLVGWLASLRAKRNLLPASMQVAAYGATYLVAWAFFGAVIINSAMRLTLTGLFEIAEAATKLPVDVWIVFFAVVPNAFCGILFLRFILRGTNGARYANR